MKMGELTHGLHTFRDSVADGWNRLRRSATGALTRFKSESKSNLPVQAEVDDEFDLPSPAWSLVSGDVFEDERRVVVRLEVPGMSKKDFDLQVLDDVLVVRGHKRFERESTQGRYRVLQCAYGSFVREVPLPTSVRADEAAASYTDGVLKIVLPKAQTSKPRHIAVNVG